MATRPRHLVIGTGFVGSIVAESLRQAGHEVDSSSRSGARSKIVIDNGPALDHQLAQHDYAQVVIVGQLTAPRMEWVLERIAGPRWVVFSSQQLAADVRVPLHDVAGGREADALARGACVLRPTMIYGHGRDQNLTRLIRIMKLLPVAAIPVGARQLVQPIHVDDIGQFLISHSLSPTGGLFPVGGSESLPVGELLFTLAEALGKRRLMLPLSISRARRVHLLARAVGLRADQVERLRESKVADNSLARRIFGWEPVLHGIRLEQAVQEALLASTSR